MANVNTPAPLGGQAAELCNSDIRAAAYDKHHRNDTLEIDTFNDVLKREDGAWVVSHVWITYEEVRAAMKQKGFSGKARPCKPKYQPQDHWTLVNPKDKETEDVVSAA